MGSPRGELCDNWGIAILEPWNLGKIGFGDIWHSSDVEIWGSLGYSITPKLQFKQSMFLDLSRILASLYLSIEFETRSHSQGPFKPPQGQARQLLELALVELVALQGGRKGPVGKPKRCAATLECLCRLYRCITNNVTMHSFSEKSFNQDISEPNCCILWSSNMGNLITPPNTSQKTRGTFF